MLASLGPCSALGSPLQDKESYRQRESKQNEDGRSEEVATIVAMATPTCGLGARSILGLKQHFQAGRQIDMGESKEKGRLSFKNASQGPDQR